ncbi:MAG: bifunctional 4-hydroxy-2-oxoglutarate aldolase/2-dehydro-3-deoxy-phosphogluconate aldolase [Syntrophales bacterium]
MQLDVPVIGILRGVEGTFFRNLMDTSFSAGLQAIEITMNTADVLQIISDNLSAVPPGKLLGVGTIRNLSEAKQAVAAGAMFLVTPNTDTAVVEYARANAIPVIAGALTPTEVYTAWSAGADMVKIFPCRAFGPDYLRELQGPYERIPLVAVGGVDLNNVQEYFRAGAQAVGVSSALFGRRAFMEKDLSAIGKNVRTLIGLCPNLKQ